MEICKVIEWDGIEQLALKEDEKIVKEVHDNDINKYDLSNPKKLNSSNYISVN